MAAVSFTSEMVTALVGAAVLAMLAFPAAAQSLLPRVSAASPPRR